MSCQSHIPHRMTPEVASVVPIQVGARGAGSVFLVPGAGATVSTFLSLAQCFGPDTTLHGLQPRGFDGMLPPHATVEDAAAEFVAAIRKVCPRGPYRIVGHSFGGWIAYEIALQLAALGESLNSVILLDSEPPGFLEQPPGPLTEREERVWVLLRLCRLLGMASGKKLDLEQSELQSLDERQQLEALARVMKTAGLLSPASRLAVVESMVRVFTVNMKTYYVPTGIVPAEVVLVFPEEHPEDDPDDEPLDLAARLEQWRSHVPHLRTVSTPGNHMTMLDSPNVATIGKLLTSLWGRKSV
jgi:thioesterase domain-containing protein